MRAAKLAASFVIVGMLAAQVAVSLPHGFDFKGWYWPFMEYPMYSRAHAATDSVVYRELRGRPCADPDTAVSLSYRTLHMLKFRYWYMLRTIAEQGPNHEDMQRQLGRLAAEAPGGPYCRAEVWERRFLLSDRSRTWAGAIWRSGRGWPLGAAPGGTHAERPR